MAPRNYTRCSVVGCDRYLYKKCEKKQCSKCCMEGGTCYQHILSNNRNERQKKRREEKKQSKKRKRENEEDNGEEDNGEEENEEDNEEENDIDDNSTTDHTQYNDESSHNFHFTSGDSGEPSDDIYELCMRKDCDNIINNYSTHCKFGLICKDCCNKSETKNILGQPTFPCMAHTTQHLSEVIKKLPSQMTSILLAEHSNNNNNSDPKFKKMKIDYDSMAKKYSSLEDEHLELKKSFEHQLSQRLAESNNEIKRLKEKMKKNNKYEKLCRAYKKIKSKNEELKKKLESQEVIRESQGSESSMYVKKLKELKEKNRKLTQQLKNK